MNTTKEDIKFYDVFNVVLTDFPSRSRDILAKRFGIGVDKPLTLQAIGDDYDITRERVRQIVQSGLKGVQNADEYNEFIQAKYTIITHIEDNEGIISVDDIAVALGGSNRDEHGAIRFLIEGISDISAVNAKKHPVDEDIIVVSSFDMDQWNVIHDDIKTIFEEKQKVYTSKRLHKKIIEDNDIEHMQLEKYLAVSREIGKNPFDKWGLYGWDEISPRGVREKALLIMKEENKPMHFHAIAKAIDKNGLGKMGKRSHPQTVHNELIRDDNFVLVGRGVYALSTDNYIGGTVKEVIENILENSDKALTSDEIINRVLEVRYVKPSTVKVNLNAVAKKMNKNIL